VDQGETLRVATLVLYEWWRGKRTADDIAAQEALCPASVAVPFGPEQAALAARLYRRLGRPRPRVVDLAIAACAITDEAGLWTLNPGDFRDIPDLRLVS
jgi:predicted nucleic acid-binding protein